MLEVQEMPLDEVLGYEWPNWLVEYLNAEYRKYQQLSDAAILKVVMDNKPNITYNPPK